MGADVTAFTGSAAKNDEAVGFGASKVLNYKVIEVPPMLRLQFADASCIRSQLKSDMKSAVGKFDLILMTASGSLDMKAYLNLLKPR
jgi:D-arabinose 1-dehydrogenase-like Zn-dependent alcohol dehydrogenase